jgi:hypothetical protein
MGVEGTRKVQRNKKDGLKLLRLCKEFRERSDIIRNNTT